MFGLGAFGELAFAEPLCVAQRILGGGRRGLIGGSGFPPGSNAGALLQGLDDDERRRREREEQEIVALITAGSL